MPLNEKYDLFDINEDEYLKKLNFIKEGFGEKIAYVVYFTDDYNRGQLKFKNMIVRRLGDEIDLSKHNVVLKYYVTHLSLYDQIRKTEMEDFDYIKIEDIGYYRFTDIYISLGIKTEVEKSLIEQIDKYDNIHWNNHLDIDDEEYLKNNTEKYFKKSN